MSMIILDKEFLKPSKEARKLSILESLALDSSQSQHDLGARTNLSGAMVNQYLKELQGDRLIRFEPANGKKFRYRLTPEGERFRDRIFAMYSSELVRLYTALKETITDRLDALWAAGVKKVVLFGASETCEVVLSALRAAPCEVLAVVDNDPAKQGTIFHGHVVCPPHILEAIRCDAVIVTSYGSREEICQQLVNLTATRQMEIVRL